MTRIKPRTSYPWYMRLIFWFQRRQYGKDIEAAQIWGRSPRLLFGFTAFYNALNRKRSPIDPKLRSLIAVRVSQINQCPFCIDINSTILLQRGADQKQLEILPKFQESPLFSEKEKIALEYAEAVTKSSQEDLKEVFPQLKQHFTDDEIVELTGLISFQTSSNKFNTALDIPSGEFCV